ncbi:MAG: hypothetical protein GKS01_04360 [Alphaproteobacteria bacterium]|nr:hypothetical protein [Alphaproteobacteria bacterium]
MVAGIRFVALGIVFFLMISGPAIAAPQILGVVASAAPVPMTCSGGLCTAEFSAFCMQQHRVSPRGGTPYQTAKGTNLTLVSTAADGTKRSVIVNDKVSIQSKRGHFAVQVTLPESTVKGLGGQVAALDINVLASLVPMVQVGDETPLSKAEIAHVTGIQRKIVAKALASDREQETITVGTMTRLISALPRYGRVSAARRQSLWRDIVGPEPTQRSNIGLQKAAKEFRYCKHWADTGRGYGLRHCLEEMHDFKADQITKKAWKAVLPGG